MVNYPPGALGGKVTLTGNAEGCPLTYRITKGATPHRTGKLEDEGCVTYGRRDLVCNL